MHLASYHLRDLHLEPYERWIAVQGAYEVVDGNDNVVKEEGSDMPQQHVDDDMDDDVHNDVEKVHDVVLVEGDTSYFVDDTPSSSFHSYYFHNIVWHVWRHVNYELTMVVVVEVAVHRWVNLTKPTMSTVLVSNHFPRHPVVSSSLYLTAEQ